MSDNTQPFFFLAKSMLETCIFCDAKYCMSHYKGAVQGRQLVGLIKGFMFK